MTRLPEKILLATGNAGKVKEIRHLVSDLRINLLSLADVVDPPDVIEDGDTFEANALKKARVLSNETGLVSLADDSGLCVDALDGRPGVLSARYAGDDASDEDKFKMLLREMADVSEDRRTARFVCVLALVWPDGPEEIFRGECEGLITHEPNGTAGFGYDPVFYYPAAGCTFSQMELTEKNQVSHRGRALKLLAEYLTELAAGKL
ncbi:XTP/dITP diphosphatase [Thermodesulfobacteriota bacterium]